MLRRRDKGTGNIDFVDISSPEYNPAENAGISYEQVSSLSGQKWCTWNVLKSAGLHPLGRSFPCWIQASLLTPFHVCIMKLDVHT